eukprot:726895-Pelagomonas_calceolata.AAC.1
MFQPIVHQPGESMRPTGISTVPHHSPDLTSCWSTPALTPCAQRPARRKSTEHQSVRNIWPAAASG